MSLMRSNAKSRRLGNQVSFLDEDPTVYLDEQGVWLDEYGESLSLVDLDQLKAPKTRLGQMRQRMVQKARACHNRTGSCWLHLLTLLLGAMLATLYHRGIHRTNVVILSPLSNQTDVTTAPSMVSPSTPLLTTTTTTTTTTTPAPQPSSNIFAKHGGPTSPPQPSTVPSSLPSSSPSVKGWNQYTEVEELPLPTPISDEFPKYHLPILAVGYPRSGSMHIYTYFSCSGLHSQHYCCCGSHQLHWPCTGGKGIGRCMKNNLLKDRPILHACGDSNLYAEMDMEDVHHRIFLPQHFHLQEFTQQFPNATFLLTRMPAEDWADRVIKWFDLAHRFMVEFHIRATSYPGGIRQALIDIYHNHTQEVRVYVAANPSHGLIEINVEETNVVEHMGSLFGGNASCWPDDPPN